MFAKRFMVVAIDFDHTIWDTPNNKPLPFAREALGILREKGIKIVIHSCNNKSWIEKCLNNADIRYDWLWDDKGKPVADLYIDDCGYHFAGSWDMPVVLDIMDRLEVRNPMIGEGWL